MYLIQWSIRTDTPLLATHYIVLPVHDGLQIRLQRTQSSCRSALLGKCIMDSHLNGVRDVWVERRDRARLRGLEHGKQSAEERILS